MLKADIPKLTEGQRLYFRSRPRYETGLPRVYDATVLRNRRADTTVEIELHFPGQDARTLLYYSGRQSFHARVALADFHLALPPVDHIGQYEYQPHTDFPRYRDR